MEVNGLFGGKRGRRRWCGGVVVVGMVEEMEEKKVEELVVEMEGKVVVEKWEKVAGHGKARSHFVGCHACWKEKGKRMNEREGKRGVVI